MSPQEIRPFKETGEHSYHRRSFAHDYYAPFIYHIIIKKAKGCESFGTVEGDARIAPGENGGARIKESPIGRVIVKTILHFPYDFPIIKLMQFCVMPDHVHLLLQVRHRSENHLDFYIDQLKGRVVAMCQVGEIFAPGYCDKPLYDNRSLDGLFRYIRENPHRLAMRKQYPQFFQRVRKLNICGQECEAYGNLFLLRNPDKEAVKISRKFTLEERRQKQTQWLSAAMKGTVLVSPFTSQAEKAIRVEGENLGARIILIIHEAFPELFKPYAHDFALCAEGRLLIISLGLPPKTELSRAICLRMNDLALSISSTGLS